MENYEKLVQNVRLAFKTGRTRDVNFRIEQLKTLLRLYKENTDEILEALQQDLRKPKLEALTYEIVMLKKDAGIGIKNLKKWAKTKHIPRNVLSIMDKVYITKEPYGVVLILGPWNYPFHLTLLPLSGAIAAGNCVIIKPSELSTHCSKKIAELIPRYLDEDCYKVVLGGPEETQSLLEEKFDYIFHTGSPYVGRLVHAAANKHLTPVTLELGGKCPVFIDDSVNFRMTAERVMWAKCVCVGQTCVSPDYIICSKDVEEKFVKECKQVMHDYYGDNLQDNKDLSRIINLRHLNRLRKLLSETKGNIIMGGSVDEYDLWIEPTIIIDVEPSDAIMQDEVFGPILPIIRANSTEDAIKFINERPNPLAAYVFTAKQKVVNLFLENTQTGGVSVNDCMYHTGIFDVPFGGVGNSGMGQYHGKWSFETFSRPRSVLQRSFNYLENKNSISIRYPPYTSIKIALMKFGLMNFERFYVPHFTFLPHFICFLVGLLIMYLFYYFKILHN